MNLVDSGSGSSHLHDSKTILTLRSYGHRNAQKTKLNDDDDDNNNNNNNDNNNNNNAIIIAINCCC